MGYSHIAILIDRSGSMIDIKRGAEEGVNSFIKAQRDVDGKCSVGVAQFDSQFDIVTKPVPLSEVTDITIVPRNSTALLDAMGRYIVDTDEYLDSLTEKPDQVFFVIVTDGKENSSREWTYQGIEDLVSKHPNWHFAFIAANMDNIAEAAKLGIKRTSTMAYDYTDAGASYAYKAATTAVLQTRSGSSWNLPEKATEE